MLSKQNERGTEFCREANVVSIFKKKKNSCLQAGELISILSKLNGKIPGMSRMVFFPTSVSQTEV